MIDPVLFLEELNSQGVDHFFGVPDSLLKELCEVIDNKLAPENHIITANEGNAIALAAGYNMATSNVACVYMQNSGLGNCVNPLTSLADPKVYGIPMLMIVGWRGEPGVKDEPQHVKQGEITREMLDVLGIEYQILEPELGVAKEQIKNLLSSTRKNSSPTVLLVRKSCFSKFKGAEVSGARSLELREKFIEEIEELSSKMENVAVLSTTGKISRELYEARVGRRGSCSDFLNVGAMGHVSQVALGVAMQRRDKTVICIDGDGAAIMHLGGLAIIGQQKTKNFIHIILNNAAHESVGGQATVAGNISLSEIAKSCGYEESVRVDSTADFTAALTDMLEKKQGPYFLEARVGIGSRSDLGRPKESPAENKKNFVRQLA